jgi:anti-sigma-K factor RskA
MMAYSEDHIVLAAEYALGTLDADERAQVETMMSVDKDFAVMVEAWETRLGALNQMVGPVEPRPEVWGRIKTAAGLSQPQAPLVLPDAPPPPSAVPQVTEAPVVADTSNMIRLSSAARRWRNVATVTSAIAAALVAMIAVGVYQPDLLPDRLRPKPRTQVVEAKPPQAPPPSAQYVAVLQKDGGLPAFILTVDGASRNFTIRKVGTSPEPGKSFELWLISDRLPRPRSLGVIGDGDFTGRPVLASYDPDLINNATYAVTVEQTGGSPDGNPHSAPVFTGKLIESVPPAAPTPARLISGRQKNNTPVGSGRFRYNQLGVVGPSIFTWRLWGAGKEPCEFVKFVSGPPMCSSWLSSPPCRPL